jgi:hypothetical protein
MRKKINSFLQEINPIDKYEESNEKLSTETFLIIVSFTASLAGTQYFCSIVQTKYFLI